MTEINALLKRAKKLIRDKNFEEAESCCRSILLRDKANYMALVLLAKSQGYTDEVPELYYEAIDLDPSKLLAWQGLAKYYEHTSGNAARSKLCSILQVMITLPIKEREIIKILFKISNVGLYWRNYEPVSIIVKLINERPKKKIKDLAVVELVKLLNCDIYFDPAIFPAIRRILEQLNDKHPSESIKLLICKVIFQQCPIVTSVNEIVQLDFFSQCIEIRQWLCKQLCIFFVNYDTFKPLDVEKYIVIIREGLEDSKLMGLLTSMISYEKSDYWKAYEQCIRTVSAELNIYEAVYLIKCVFRTKQWLYAAKLSIIFLVNTGDSKFRIIVEKLLFHSFVQLEKWPRAINIGIQLAVHDLDKDEYTDLAICFIEVNATLQPIMHYLDYNQRKLIQAHSIIKQEKYKEAENILMNCENEYRKYFYLGKVYWHLQDYEKCFDNLMKSCNAKRDYADTNYYLGLFYYEYKNNLQRAAQYLHRAHFLRESDGLFVNVLSEILMKLGLDDKALKLLLKTTPLIENKESWFYLRLGIIYFKKLEWGNAIKNFSAVLVLSPDHIIATQYLGDAYYGKHNYDLALSAYEKALTLNPDNSHQCHCLTYMGYINVNNNNYDLALQQFKSVIRIDAYYIYALKGFAFIFLKMAKKSFSTESYFYARDNAQVAVNCLYRALSKKKTLASLWEMLADALLLITKLPEVNSYVFVKRSIDDTGEDIMTRKLDIYPLAIAHLSNISKCGSPTPCNILATTYFQYYVCSSQLRHGYLAFDYAVSWVKESPLAWRSWNLLAIISSLLSRYELAQPCFIKCLTITPNVATSSVWINLGCMYLKLNINRWAYYCYWRGHCSRQSSGHAWSDHSLTAIFINKEESINIFRYPSLLGFYDINTLTYVFWICFTLKNLNWKNDPKCKYAIEGLNAITKGMDLIMWYLTYNPYDPCAYNMLGILQKKKGLLKPALKSFQKAYVCAKEDDKNFFLLNTAKTLAGLAKYGIEDNTNSSYGLDLALYQSGNYEEAYSVYKMSLQWRCNDDGDKTDIYTAMAGIVYTLKGKDDAKTLLLNCLKITQKGPAPYSLFSLCSLGIIDSDKSLAMAILQELRKYKKKKIYGFDIAFLKACILARGNIKLAIEITCDASYYPNNCQMWFSLLKCCLTPSPVMASIASCCTRIAMDALNYDKQNIIHIGRLFALAGLAEYYIGDRDKSLRLVKKGMHVNPCQPELWAVLLISFLTNGDWLKKRSWILWALSHMRRNLDLSRPLRKWVTLLQKKIHR